MAKRVTLGDVARAAGVHSGTVSRALNEDTRSQVSASTVKKVRAVAEELGYVPDVVARALRTQTSMTVGVIIPDLMNPIFPPMVRGIEHVLQQRGYTALLANTDSRDDVELTAFESLLQRRVDGFILATGHHGDQPAITRAHRAGALVVMVNREAGDGTYPVVTSDNAQGMMLAVRHLIELGHRRIMHLAGPHDYSTTRMRADAFAAATGVERSVAARTVNAEALTIDAGVQAMDAILADGGDLPTGVIGGNDLVALGAIRSLHAHDLRVPEDVSVVGFNDMPFAADFSPPLTTVRVPLREMGAAAATMLLDAIDDGRQAPGAMVLPVSLVVRESTASCPR